MKHLIQYLLIVLLLCFVQRAAAQMQVKKDTVVQLYGVVMTADSLQAIPGASVIVEDKGRGTITNNQGVFSIVVLKGDKVRFSVVGFKDKIIDIPDNIPGNQYSLIQLMVTDTAYLPATIIKARPSRAQFERDFVNTDIPADQLEIARRNTDEATRRILLATLPADGREAVNMQFRQQAVKYSYMGQQPPVNLLNPMAWADFIQAWKRGDFRKKSE
ncbi:carboxypeptidase-like regulatory domain-containing protein [Ilyomonas limi]|uniref:Carboxypeptidase-like regulatory domain-containing protein n=1 Tax=Ilyomonas limi TaxID=2575867 RepID=A0A4U3LA15_9BACT|nr:carboxypeptidase-like regulatory domain-containing protein [Ilyomonas limi]TKK71952.1 carboxypeptidase-like regulatory domain-containing protein [Ilyomonas limi]